jgi:hypothetical protein
VQVTSVLTRGAALLGDGVHRLESAVVDMSNKNPGSGGWFDYVCSFLFHQISQTFQPLCWKEAGCSVTVFDSNTPFGHRVRYQHAVGSVFDTNTPFGPCVR